MDDPFDPKSLARSAARSTHGQREAREFEWTQKSNPHISDTQLSSFFDVAEILLEQGFTGSSNQVQRLARSVRTVLIKDRYIYH